MSLSLLRTQGGAAAGLPAVSKSRVRLLLISGSGSRVAVPRAKFVRALNHHGVAGSMGRVGAAGGGSEPLP